MTIDELASAIKASSPEEPAQRLATYILEWRQDDSSVEALQTMVERFIGYTWFSSNEIHKQIRSQWSIFHESCISKIQNMTMNERLYCFGLTSRFDSAMTESARKIIYDKLLARA